MVEDTGTSIQDQNLIADDVADEINSAMGEQMNGSVTPPTVVKPTHTPPPAPAVEEPAAAPAEPTATEPADTQVEEPVVAPAEPVDDTGGEDQAPVMPEVAEADRGTGNFSELQDIKQSALSELSPLVEHLEQGPEDRFNTLLMMIRASDDSSLVKPAYEAAQKIDDDKKRAQALLDVVNEVNYLTRPQPDSEQS